MPLLGRKIASTRLISPNVLPPQRFLQTRRTWANAARTTHVQNHADVEQFGEAGGAAAVGLDGSGTVVPARRQLPRLSATALAVVAV